MFAVCPLEISHFILSYKIIIDSNLFAFRIIPAFYVEYTSFEGSNEHNIDLLFTLRYHRKYSLHLDNSIKENIFKRFLYKMESRGKKAIFHTPLCRANIKQEGLS